MHSGELVTVPGFIHMGSFAIEQALDIEDGPYRFVGKAKCYHRLVRGELCSDAVDS